MMAVVVIKPFHKLSLAYSNDAMVHPSLIECSNIDTVD